VGSRWPFRLPGRHASRSRPFVVPLSAL